MKTFSKAKAKAKIKTIAKQMKQSAKESFGLPAPTGYDFVIADRVGFLNEAAWDSIADQESFFFERNYLKMLEVNGPKNISMRYLMVIRGSEVLAIAVLQVVSVKGTKVTKIEIGESEKKSAKAVLKKIVKPVTDKVLESLEERILVCGNLLSYGFHCVAFKKGVQKDLIWHAISEGIYRIRRGEKLIGQTDFVLLKDITPEELPDSRILSKLSYREFETEPNMVLDILPSWKSYDNYLSSLQSKYRSAVKQQIFKPLEDSGCVIEHLKNLKDYSKEIHQLYLQVHENADLRMFTLPEEYFPALEKLCGRNFLCSVIKRDKKLLGFIITIRDGDVAFGYHIGYDKEAAKEIPLYLRLLHACVSDAIQLKCKELSLGRTALEPKARLGCKPQEISVYIQHRHAVMNALVKQLLNVVPHNEAPERNPFKNIGENN